MLYNTIRTESIMIKVAADASDLSKVVKTVGRGAHDAVEAAQRTAYNAGNDSTLGGIWNNIKASLDRNDLVSGALTPAAIAAGIGGLYNAFSDYDSPEEAKNGRFRKILGGIARGALYGGAAGIGGNLLMRGFGKGYEVTPPQVRIS